MEKVYAIFVAGGSGSRMGTSTPKQFLLLDGIPVLQRAIETFIGAIPGLSVVTVLPKEHVESWKELCFRYAMDYPQTIVRGGITRFHSVRNALRRIPSGSIVLIHDGVRPLVSADLVNTLLSEVRPGMGAVPSLPVTDTLKAADGISPDPDRLAILSVQTPQVFYADDIKQAYGLPYDNSFSDDSSVARKYGIPVKFIPGEKTNIKLTTPEDLDLAGAILHLRSCRS